jgi:hypothetical protein
MGSLRIDKPICVVDCNFIQTCRGEAEDVPSHWDCLLISSVFSELASKEESERAFLFARFTSWVRRNKNRLWMARQWPDLLKAHETSPHTVRRIRLADFVSKGVTEKLRKYAADPNVEWSASTQTPEISRWLQDVASGRDSFLSLADECKRFIEGQAGKPSTKSPQTPEAIREYVQQFNIADAIVHRGGEGPYGDRCWRRHLDEFPDRLLIGRYARLQLYYLIRRTLGDSRKFENNWDDMFYAIAASYSGHIATHDKRLIKACNILSPGVRVFPSAGEATEPP